MTGRKRAFKDMLADMADLLAARDMRAVASVGCTLAIVTVVLSRWISSLVNRRKLNTKRDKKIADLRTKMGNWKYVALNEISESESDKITSMSFDELLEVMRDKIYTPVNVLRAFQHKAARENEKFNFISEPIDDAEERALRLYDLTDEEKKHLPLYGIPITVKENYHIKGYNPNMGCARRLDIISEFTSPLIQALIDYGAVPFLRTNIPQTCMSIDSGNPIYGQTTNPHNTARVSGGSSGGEGACIAAGASLLGLGSDIGGSLRCPAAWSDIYSLKPTAGRISQNGDCSIDFNGRVVSITCGPMGRDVNSLVAAMKCFGSETAFRTDPLTPPIPFNEKVLISTKPLRVAYIEQMSPIYATESSKHAVKHCVDILRKNGHKIVNWSGLPDPVKAITEGFIPDLFGDGGAIFLESIKDDIHYVHIQETVKLCGYPAWLIKLMATLLKPFVPDHFYKYLLGVIGCKNVSDFWKLEEEIKNYRRKVVKELQDEDVDVIICPAMPCPALHVGRTQDAIGMVAYLAIWNLLNFPAGVVPVSKLTAQNVETDIENYPASDLWHKAVKTMLPGSEGLPIAVQCVTLPHQEETCLRVMKELESVIGYKV